MNDIERDNRPLNVIVLSLTLKVNTSEEPCQCMSVVNTVYRIRLSVLTNSYEILLLLFIIRIVKSCNENNVYHFCTKSVSDTKTAYSFYIK
jgi:hypothetical protein